MTWMITFGIIYISLVLGVILKMVLYKLPLQRMVVAPIMPLVLFLAIPIYTMKDSVEEEAGLSQSILKFLVVCYITIKYFPGLVGLAIAARKRQVCLTKSTCQQNVLYSNERTVNLVFNASERLCNDLNFV